MAEEKSKDGDGLHLIVTGALVTALFAAIVTWETVTGGFWQDSTGVALAGVVFGAMVILSGAFRHRDDNRGNPQ